MIDFSRESVSQGAKYSNGCRIWVIDNFNDSVLSIFFNSFFCFNLSSICWDKLKKILKNEKEGEGSTSKNTFWLLALCFTQIPIEAN